MVRVAHHFSQVFIGAIYNYFSRTIFPKLLFRMVLLQRTETFKAVLEL
jgi:hypothetical protein